MNGSANLQNHLGPARIAFFSLVVGFIFTIYVYRLFVLQILENETWEESARINREDVINIPAARGIIYDRNGYVLARNIPSYNVVITAANLPDDEGEIQRIFRELSVITGVPVNRGEIDPAENPFVPCFSDHGIAQIAEYGDTSTPYEPVRVKCDVERDLALAIEEKAMNWPGVSIETVPVRDYPTGSLTANIIGYLGPISAENEQFYRDKGFLAFRDKVGFAGVERAFQDWLAGENGEQRVEVDVGGKVMVSVGEARLPKPGHNVILTIDSRFQQAAESILIDEIDSWNDFFLRDAKPDKLMTSGVVIAINPQTGEILSMVSYPTYENNRMARFIPAYYYEQLSADPRIPLLNHAVGDELPAGSVFKLVTAVGALNESVVTPEQIIETPPKITLTERFFASDLVNEREFVDWNPAGFGRLDFVHAVANSSNVYFYKIGGGYREEVPDGGLGICSLGTYAKALGYGDYPGSEFPDEADGLIPDPTWKRLTHGESWTTGDTYISSVGQSFVVATPLQVLLSAATIANNGMLMRPTILREVVDADGNIVQPFQPDMKWDITATPVITVYQPETRLRGCVPTGETKTVDPWVIQKVQEGMRLAVLEGTLAREFGNTTIAVAGKTGTAEYCDKYVLPKGLCIFGNWPTHAWTVAYAPYDNPEIAVIAFIYNGGEGASVAGPVVRRVLEAYFELKTIDNALGLPGGQPNQ